LKKLVEALLESLATRDSLTNLFNRRQLFFLAATEFERSIRYKHPLCVLMLDIDHFKQVNDQFGHQVGDQVLINCAKTIQTTLRDSSDIIGRYGGEEFIAILPEITSARAFLVGERLRKTIHDLQHDYKDVHLSVTISIGIAEFAGNHALTPSLTMDELINQADQALYTAKKNGRNRVEIYRPDRLNKLHLPPDQSFQAEGCR
jgi:diguanylate cyclase (GGDEF)-like protein